jgi:conserved hypothetical protein TIGR00247
VASKHPRLFARRRSPLFSLWPWILLGVLIGVGADAWVQLHRPLWLPLPFTIEVSKGEQLDSVLQRLEQRGVMLTSRQGPYLSVLARIDGQARRIKAGEYVLEPGTTALQMLQEMVSGKILLHRLRLIEGWTFHQAWQAISEDHFIRHTLPADAKSAAIMKAIGYPGVAAEGRFFPDTYRFPKGETDVDFLRRAYAEMYKRLHAVWADRAKDLPFKRPYDALIMASLIERETAQPSERARISGVFARRLKIGMRLQTDPSVMYGLGPDFDGPLTIQNLRHDTPYNTYTRNGLPPTPICLPGEASLKAAVHPRPGKALYFVSKGNGTHKFSDTLEEQNAAVRKYILHGQ